MFFSVKGFEEPQQSKAVEMEKESALMAERRKTL